MTIDRIDALTRSIINSQYFESLSSYSVTSPSLLPSIVASNCGPPPATINGAINQLSAFASCVLQNNPQINPSVAILNVLLPPQTGALSPTTDFCHFTNGEHTTGEHNLFGSPVEMTLIPTNSTCANVGALLRTMTHEMVEGATDPNPEQIARRLPFDFPADDSMRISHEAIYQALYVQGRGALRRELTACRRTGRALRMPRARVHGKGKSFVDPEIMISERPAEIADRAVPGHWEGDLILGLGSSAIGTLVERMTRFTILLHLPRMAAYGDLARIKNGPALAGHGAAAVRDAITRTITTLPEEIRQSLTWDQGAEMAQHADLRIDTGLQVYFCDPRSPWQRGTNENTNGLLRQYFPKGTDLSAHSADDIAAVAMTLNSRPRKALGWKTPAEALDQYFR